MGQGWERYGLEVLTQTIFYGVILSLSQPCQHTRGTGDRHLTPGNRAEGVVAVAAAAGV